MLIEKPLQGIASFLKAPMGDLGRRAGIFGVPFDGATSGRPGARGGPNAVRQASMFLTDGDHPVFETNAAAALTDLGDIITGVNVDATLNAISSTVAAHPFLAARKPLFFLGGDHTITLGVLRAMAARHPNLHVLHFDAHCDTWEDHFGEPCGHGTWVRNVIEEGLLPAENILSIGMRSPVDPQTRDWLVNHGGLTISSRGAMRMGAAAIADLVRRKVTRHNPLYITFDIDVLDPAFAPGTGTPEIAGLTPHFALDVLETLHGMDIVGMDVVEVNPTCDPAQTTALAAATLLWTVSSMLICDDAV